MQRFGMLFVIVILMLVGISSIRSQETSLEPVQRLGARGTIAAAEWSADGEFIAISTENGVDIFDKDLNYLTRWQVPSMPGSMNPVWHPDGSLLALAPDYQYFFIDQTVPETHPYAYIWSPQTGETLYTVDMPDATRALALWNADGTLVQFFYETETTQWLIVLDIVSGVETRLDLNELELIRQFLWGWSWGEDNTIVGVNIGSSERVTIDYESAQILQLESIPEQPFERQPIISPDGSAIIFPDEGIMRLKTTRGEEVVFQTTDEPTSFSGLFGAVWSMDSQYVAMVANTGSSHVIVADANTGETVIEITLDEPALLPEHLKFNAQANRFLVVTPYDYELQLYDLPSGDLITKRLHLVGTNAIDLNPDGTRLATAPLLRPHAFVWNTETRETALFLNSPFVPVDTNEPIYNVAWSPDGRYIATGSIAYAPSSEEVVPIDIFIWDASTGDYLHTVEAEAILADFVIALDWSGDSRYLAWTIHSNQTAHSRVGVWDVENQERLYHEQFPGNVHDISFTADPNHLTFGLMGIFDELEEQTLIGDINIMHGTFTPLYEFEEWTSISSVDWNHDRAILATARNFVGDEAYTLIEFWLMTASGELVKVYEQTRLKPSASHNSDIEWNPTDDSLAIGYPTFMNGQVYYIFDYLQFDRNTTMVTVAETYLPDVSDLSPAPYIQTYLGIAWSGDGQRLAVATFANAVWIYER
jgi:WD40 repeat protein